MLPVKKKETRKRGREGGREKEREGEGEIDFDHFYLCSLAKRRTTELKK